jgi:adenosylcobyric acid synthase
LIQDGMATILRHTGWPGLGLIPFFANAARLPAEDAVALEGRDVASGGTCIVAVPRLPHIANFDDLDPLRAEPAVRLVICHPGEPLPGNADLVILPGSKATLADLRDFRRNGWEIDLLAHVRRGGRVLGICGGFQLLGRAVADPDGIEGPPASLAGLGLLDVETVLGGDKVLHDVTGTSCAGDVPFRGYEMHVGRTRGPDCARPLLRFADGRQDGAISANGNIRATYVHGLFADDNQRAALLAWIGARASGSNYDAGVDRVLDELASHLGRHIDLDGLLRRARGWSEPANNHDRE